MAVLPWQEQFTPLHRASALADFDVVLVLVDSKANLEARGKVAMWPVWPSACHISGGGGVCMWYVCPAVLLCMVERADDDRTPW